MIAKSMTVLFLVATLLAVYNVYGDNTLLMRRAESLACGSSPCVKLLRAERTPLEQSFTFQTSLAPPRTRSVRCARAVFLVGTFSCSTND
jgi:hypothetical protein